MTNEQRSFVDSFVACDLSFFIGHLSFVICKSFSSFSADVRKNVAPASSRQTVRLTRKELSRPTCLRDAGAAIFHHALRHCVSLAAALLRRVSCATRKDKGFHDRFLREYVTVGPALRK